MSKICNLRNLDLDILFTFAILGSALLAVVALGLLVAVVI